MGNCAMIKNNICYYKDKGSSIIVGEKDNNLSIQEIVKKDREEYLNVSHIFMLFQIEKKINKSNLQTNQN